MRKKKTTIKNPNTTQTQKKGTHEEYYEKKQVKKKQNTTSFSVYIYIKSLIYNLKDLIFIGCQYNLQSKNNKRRSLKKIHIN